VDRLSQFGRPTRPLTILLAHSALTITQGIMNRNPNNFINPVLTSSRYASPFRLLSPKKKTRESITSGSSVSSSSSSSTSSSRKKKKAPIVLKTKLPKSMDLMKALRQLRGPRSRHQSSLSSTETETTESSEHSTPNVMQFLIDICPEDILPKILAFAGPQKTAALSKVNRVWRDVIDEDWTWRVLCEDLYKVRSCVFFVSIPFP
jgi:hypothetical protein